MLFHYLLLISTYPLFISSFCSPRGQGEDANIHTHTDVGPFEAKEAAGCRAGRAITRRRREARRGRRSRQERRRERARATADRWTAGYHVVGRSASGGAQVSLNFNTFK